MRAAPRVRVHWVCAVMLGCVLGPWWPGFARADLEAVEQLDELRRIRTSQNDLSRRIQVMLDAARRDRDIVRVTCLNDKLTQVNASIRTFDQRMEEWFRAHLTGRRPEANHQMSVVTALGERARLLEQEANQCLGQDLFETGATRVTTTIDAGGGGGIASRTVQVRAQAPPRPQPQPPPTAPALPDAAGADAADVGGENATRIYRASVNLGVFEVEQAQATIVAAVEALDGFVHEQTTDRLTVRVPANRFREALARVSEAGDVLARHVRSLDVGEELRDLRIRLRNAEAMRDRLEAVLASAGSVEDALAVERELERVTLEIERIRGRLRFLGDRIALSTITVAFRAASREGEVGDDLFRLPFPWLDDLGLGALLDMREPASPYRDYEQSYDEPYVDELDAEQWPLDAVPEEERW